MGEPSKVLSQTVLDGSFLSNTFCRKRQSHKAHVDASSLQRLDLLDSWHIFEFKVYSRVEFAKRQHDGRNDLRRGGCDKADTEVSDFSCAYLCGPELYIRNPLQKLFAIGKDCFSRRCKPNASSVPYKQKNTKMGLHILDLD